MIMEIATSDSAYKRTLLYTFQAPICKNVEFYILYKKNHGSRMFDYSFFFFFFFGGGGVKPGGPGILGEDSLKR